MPSSFVVISENDTVRTFARIGSEIQWKFLGRG